MERRQEGHIVKISGRWYVRYWEKRSVDGSVQRKRVSRVLAHVTTRGKNPPEHVKRAAREHMVKLETSSIRPDQIVTLVNFAEHIWLPHVEKYEKPSTVRSHRNRWQNHLRAPCDGLWLRHVRCCDVQRILNAIAGPGKLGKNSLKRMKALLSGIFSFAKQQGYFDGENPAHNAAIPEARAPRQKHAYTLEQIRTMLAVLPEPAATVVAVAGCTGLREGEIEGLCWEDYTAAELCVRRSIWEGHVTTPKTDASADAIPVIRPLATRLEAHRLRSGNPTSGPIFATTKGTHSSLSNIRTRLVLPVLDRCGICHKAEDEHPTTDHKYRRDASLPEWHGWHAFRRGLATNLHELGVPDKIIQKILRHSNVSVTQACYIQPRDPAIAAAMRKLEEQLSAQDILGTPEAVAASAARTDKLM